MGQSTPVKVNVDKEAMDLINEGEVVDNVEENESAPEEVYKIFELFIRAEAENTAFIVKSHPRGKDALNLFADKILNVIKPFVCEGKIPEINVTTKEQLDKAFSGFWANMSKKHPIKRERKA